MRLNLALLCRTAERIEVPFRMNAFGVPRNIVLDMGSDLPTARNRELGKISLIVDPYIHVSQERLEVKSRNKFCPHVEGWEL